MGTPPGWGLEHRASNPVSIKNLTAIETSTIVKLLRPYVPVGTKRTTTTTTVVVVVIVVVNTLGTRRINCLQFESDVI
jgi:hypothetical protein